MNGHIVTIYWRSGIGIILVCLESTAVTKFQGETFSRGIKDMGCEKICANIAFYLRNDTR